jgi:hypothetical protein
MRSRIAIGCFVVAVQVLAVAGAACSGGSQHAGASDGGAANGDGTTQSTPDGTAPGVDGGKPSQDGGGVADSGSQWWSDGPTTPPTLHGHIAYAIVGTGLYVAAVDGSTPPRLVAPSGEVPAFSADGKTLYYGVYTTGTTIYALDLTADGAPPAIIATCTTPGCQIAGRANDGRYFAWVQDGTSVVGNVYAGSHIDAGPDGASGYVLWPGNPSSNCVTDFWLDPAPNVVALLGNCADGGEKLYLGAPSTASPLFGLPLAAPTIIPDIAHPQVAGGRVWLMGTAPNVDAGLPGASSFIYSVALDGADLRSVNVGTGVANVGDFVIADDASFLISAESTLPRPPQGLGESTNFALVAHAGSWRQPLAGPLAAIPGQDGLLPLAFTPY